MRLIDLRLGLGVIMARAAGFGGFLRHVSVLLPNLPSETGAFFLIVGKHGPF